LSGASTGFQTFNSAISVGNTTYYCIAGQGTSEWEVGVGTLSTSTTLARTTIISSSNSGSAVTFSAGTKDVFCTYPAAVAADTFGKNALINGDFQIWQEGTSFAAIADATYTAEMWKYVKVGAMVHTVSQSSDVPTIAEAGRKIPYSILVDCTTVDAAIAAGDYAALVTPMEGYNFVCIAGVGLCCQFWHKHTKTGTYCVGFGNSGADRSFVREYTQAVSDTWELATVLVDATPTAGTWDYTTGLGIRAFFALACGSTFQTTAGAWQTGNFVATSNQVNACDNVANNFRLAGVQLEKGSVATEFECLPIQDVLELCYRYCRRRSATAANQLGCSGMGYTTNTQQNFTDTFPVPMRAAPTFSISVDTDFYILVNATAVAATSLSAVATDTQGATLNTSNTSFGATAGAILASANANAWMQYTARF
jgi:hypothetical protein